MWVALRNLVLWCIVALLYAVVFFTSVFVFFPANILVHHAAELVYWLVRACVGDAEAFKVSEPKIAGTWGLWTGFLLSLFVWHGYNVLMEHLLAYLLAFCAVFQFCKMFFFTYILRVDCIEKTPSLYTVHLTAEGLFDHLLAIQEYAGFLICLRLFEVDYTLRLYFGTLTTMPRDEYHENAILDETTLYLSIAILLSGMAWEFCGRPFSLYERGELDMVWNFPHELVTAGREYYLPDGKTKLDYCCASHSGRDLQDEDCVICLDSLNQKVQFLDPDYERMSLSLHRRRPELTAARLRNRKVEHAGTIVGRFESGLRSAPSCDPYSGDFEAKYFSEENYAHNYNGRTRDNYMQLSYNRTRSGSSSRSRTQTEDQQLFHYQNTSTGAALRRRLTNRGNFQQGGSSSSTSGRTFAGLRANLNQQRINDDQEELDNFLDDEASSTDFSLSRFPWAAMPWNYYMMRSTTTSRGGRGTTGRTHVGRGLHGDDDSAPDLLDPGLVARQNAYNYGAVVHHEDDRFDNYDREDEIEDREDEILNDEDNLQAGRPIYGDNDINNTDNDPLYNNRDDAGMNNRDQSSSRRDLRGDTTTTPSLSIYSVRALLRRVFADGLHLRWPSFLRSADEDVQSLYQVRGGRYHSTNDLVRNSGSTTISATRTTRNAHRPSGQEERLGESSILQSHSQNDDTQHDIVEDEFEEDHFDEANNFWLANYSGSSTNEDHSTTSLQQKYDFPDLNPRNQNSLELDGMSSNLTHGQRASGAAGFLRRWLEFLFCAGRRRTANGESGSSSGYGSLFDDTDIAVEQQGTAVTIGIGPIEITLARQLPVGGADDEGGAASATGQGAAAGGSGSNVSGTSTAGVVAPAGASSGIMPPGGGASAPFIGGEDDLDHPLLPTVVGNPASGSGTSGGTTASASSSSSSAGPLQNLRNYMLDGGSSRNRFSTSTASGAATSARNLSIGLEFSDNNSVHLPSGWYEDNDTGHFATSGQKRRRMAGSSNRNYDQSTSSTGAAAASGGGSSSARRGAGRSSNNPSDNFYPPEDDYYNDDEPSSADEQQHLSAKQYHTKQQYKQHKNVRLPCKHVFHSDCLKNWISTSRNEQHLIFSGAPPGATCPTCRHRLSWSDISVETVDQLLGWGFVMLFVLLLSFPVLHVLQRVWNLCTLGFSVMLEKWLSWILTSTAGAGSANGPFLYKWFLIHNSATTFVSGSATLVFSKDDLPLNLIAELSARTHLVHDFVRHFAASVIVFDFASIYTEWRKLRQFFTNEDSGSSSGGASSSAGNNGEDLDHILRQAADHSSTAEQAVQPGTTEANETPLATTASQEQGGDVHLATSGGAAAAETSPSNNSSAEIQKETSITATAESRALQPAAAALEVDDDNLSNRSAELQIEHPSNTTTSTTTNSTLRPPLHYGIKKIPYWRLSQISEGKGKFLYDVMRSAQHFTGVRAASAKQVDKIRRAIEPQGTVLIGANSVGEGAENAKKPFFAFGKNAHIAENKPSLALPVVKDPKFATAADKQLLLEFKVRQLGWLAGNVDVDNAAGNRNATSNSTSSSLAARNRNGTAKIVSESSETSNLTNATSAAAVPPEVLEIDLSPFALFRLVFNLCSALLRLPGTVILRLSRHVGALAYAAALNTGKQFDSLARVVQKYVAPHVKYVLSDKLQLDRIFGYFLRLTYLDVVLEKTLTFCSEKIFLPVFDGVKVSFDYFFSSPATDQAGAAAGSAASASSSRTAAEHEQKSSGSDGAAGSRTKATQYEKNHTAIRNFAEKHRATASENDSTSATVEQTTTGQSPSAVEQAGSEGEAGANDTTTTGTSKNPGGTTTEQARASQKSIKRVLETTTQNKQKETDGTGYPFVDKLLSEREQVKQELFSSLVGGNETTASTSSRAVEQQVTAAEGTTGHNGAARSVANLRNTSEENTRGSRTTRISSEVNNQLQKGERESSSTSPEKMKLVPPEEETRAKKNTTTDADKNSPAPEAADASPSPSQEDERLEHHSAQKMLKSMIHDSKLRHAMETAIRGYIADGDTAVVSFSFPVAKRLEQLEHEYREKYGHSVSNWVNTRSLTDKTATAEQELEQRSEFAKKQEKAEVTSQFAEEIVSKLDSFVEAEFALRSGSRVVKLLAENVGRRRLEELEARLQVCGNYLLESQESGRFGIQQGDQVEAAAGRSGTSRTSSPRAAKAEGGNGNSEEIFLEAGDNVDGVATSSATFIISDIIEGGASTTSRTGRKDRHDPDVEMFPEEEPQEGEDETARITLSLPSCKDLLENYFDGSNVASNNGEMNVNQHGTKPARPQELRTAHEEIGTKLLLDAELDLRKIAFKFVDFLLSPSLLLLQKGQHQGKRADLFHGRGEDHYQADRQRSFQQHQAVSNYLLREIFFPALELPKELYGSDSAPEFAMLDALVGQARRLAFHHGRASTSSWEKMQQHQVRTRLADYVEQVIATHTTVTTSTSTSGGATSAVAGEMLSAGSEDPAYGVELAVEV
ncbi:unnamed protein product [Amoebophrya sp. A120]|nr:unnamed protein product [Amoebophrya sp. A120]|eukprot:GSA120T00014926001.1